MGKDFKQVIYVQFHRVPMAIDVVGNKQKRPLPGHERTHALMKSPLPTEVLQVFWGIKISRNSLVTSLLLLALFFRKCKKMVCLDVFGTSPKQAKGVVGGLGMLRCQQKDPAQSRNFMCARFAAAVSNAKSCSCFHPKT